MTIYYHKYQKSKSSKLPLSFTSLLFENEPPEVDFALNDRCSPKLLLAESTIGFSMRLFVFVQAAVTTRVEDEVEAAAALRAGRARPGGPPSTRLRRPPRARRSLSLSLCRTPARERQGEAAWLSHTRSPRNRADIRTRAGGFLKLSWREPIIFTALKNIICSRPITGLPYNKF